jgi:hypothetical protein
MKRQSPWTEEEIRIRQEGLHFNIFALNWRPNFFTCDTILILTPAALLTAAHRLLSPGPRQQLYKGLEEGQVARGPEGQVLFPV